ncbi:MAG: SDR family NAD(P)-dependent oxidoreductase [Micromonosporaceae bacterium]|nr:SDR family NAD(P)-dependent oxidoreductase [Micromonosporaceae bacterium]
MSWDPLDLPPQVGRTFAVTGATAGIGYFAAEQLAAAGAHVVLASRSAAKLDVTAAAIRGQVPNATLSQVVIDLNSLTSINEAARHLATLPALDGILLNGGVMTMRRGETTDDGLPLMLGNHAVANVALIAGVLPTLVATGQAERHARVVHTSTGFVRRFTVSVADLSRTPRLAFTAYVQAKTATEVFAFELDRRLRAAGLPVDSIVSRPGVGVDARTPHRPGIRDATTPYRRNPFTPWAQGKNTAAWSAVRALTDPTATGGDYFGPTGPLKGLPVRVAKLARTAEPDPALAASVWDQLETLAGVRLLIADGSARGTGEANLHL